MRKRSLRAAEKKQPQVLAWLADVKIEADAAENAGPPRFDMVAYNGGALSVDGFEVPVVVDLAGATFHKSVLANLNHDRTQIVGHVTDKTNDGAKVELSGLISGGGEAAQQVLRAHKNQFPWQASIEANRLQLVSIKAGKSVSVNGQTFAGPIYVARKSVIHAVAFTGQGADPDTIVAIAAQAASNQGTQNMNPELKAFIASKSPEGFDAESLTPEQLKAWESLYEASKPAAKTAPEVFAAEKADAARREAIAAMGAEHIAANRGCGLKFITDIEALVVHAQEQGTSVKDFELELLRATRPQSRFLSSPRDKKETNVDVLTAAIAMASGLSNSVLENEFKFDDKTLEAARTKASNGLGWKQIYAEGARMRGAPIDHDDSMLYLQRVAFQPDEREVRATGFPSHSITTVLQNIANKSMKVGFDHTEQAFREVCSISSHKDFKQATRIALTGGMEFQKIGPTGEIKNAALGERTYTNTVYSYAIKTALTREDIINDDLSILNSAPNRLGRGGGLALNNVFWTLWLADSAIFNTDNSKLNYFSGATSNFQISSLQTAEAMLLAQTDPDGYPMSLQPAVVLVPPLSWAAARQVLVSNIVTNGTTSSQPNTNIYQGAYKPVVSTYIANSAFSGASTTAWYLLANPNESAVANLAFLMGKETPTVETTDVDFSQLGISMRGYFDFGVAFEEYRAGVKSKGAA